MTAICVSIAEAVKDMLNAGTFSQKFCAERSYADWELELDGEDAESLHVDVVGVTTKQEAELEGRGSQAFLVPIDIAVRKRFKQSERSDAVGRVRVEKVDELVQLVEEIFCLFVPQRLTNFTTGVWQSTQIVVNPNRLMLKNHGQFEGIVRVTFRASKAIT